MRERSGQGAGKWISRVKTRWHVSSTGLEKREPGVPHKTGQPIPQRACVLLCSAHQSRQVLSRRSVVTASFGKKHLNRGNKLSSNLRSSELLFCKNRVSLSSNL